LTYVKLHSAVLSTPQNHNLSHDLASIGASLADF